MNFSQFAVNTEAMTTIINWRVSTDTDSKDAMRSSHADALKASLSDLYYHLSGIPVQSIMIYEITPTKANPCPIHVRSCTPL